MSRNVVALRPDTVAIPASRPGMHSALDEVEAAALEHGVLYVDVALQLALARHLVDVVERVELGTEPTVAQVHAIRELRLATTELRQLVVDHTRRR